MHRHSGRQGRGTFGGWGTGVAIGLMGHGGEGPPPLSAPPLVPIRAEPGAEPGEGSGSCVFASQVSLHVPKTVLGELDCPIKDGKKSVSEVLCMSVCGGCVCVKDAKELSLHLLYGWRA